MPCSSAIVTGVGSSLYTMASSRWMAARVSGDFTQSAHRPARPAPQRTRATGLTRPQSVVGLDHDSGGEVCGRGVVGILFARHEP